MSKGKLAKFAEMATFGHVFQCPYPSPADSGFPIGGGWNRWFDERAGMADVPGPKPIVLELGCGRGEYTVGLAQRCKSKNFIGVDIKGARMWSGAAQALADGLTNVAFLRTHIEVIDRFFRPAEVDELWITFPDPQMKKATKRLTSTYFLTRYRRFLSDGGTVHLKTDSPFLYTYTRALVEVNGLPLLFDSPDLYAEKSTPEDMPDIRTYYEQQWLDRGKCIKYLRFRLPQAGELKEPDVDIELDDYRSYNRSKRSSLATSR